MKQIIELKVKHPIPVLIGYMKFMGDTMNEIDSQFYKEFFSEAFDDIVGILMTLGKNSIQEDSSFPITSINPN